LIQRFVFCLNPNLCKKILKLILTGMQAQPMDASQMVEQRRVIGARNNFLSSLELPMVLDYNCSHV
jgi:hypothetical protein